MKRAELLGKKWTCVCGQQHQVPIQKIIVQSGAVHCLPQLLQELINPKKVLVICDKITRNVLGKKIVDILSSHNLIVDELVIEQDKVVADDSTATWVTQQIKDPDLLISCGSGTITDLTKYAAFKHDKPFVAAATAASMNGYASNIVALICDGIKRSVKARPALAVVADLDVICDAPMEMTYAGLGDVISKPVSNADWKLSSIIKNQYFCDLPFKLIKDLEQIYKDNVKSLAKQDAKIMAALVEALIYSGISMVIAGSSSPASGGEHLISHTLDIKAIMQNKERNFHGAQVGITTIFTAALYEKVFSLDLSQIKVDQLQNFHAQSFQAEQKNILQKYWQKVYPEIEVEYAKKHMSWDAKQAELKFIQDNWSEIKAQVETFLVPSEQIKRVLTDGGAKTHYKQLGLSRQEFEQAVLMARYMRARYNILDLAQDFGLLELFTKQVLDNK